MIMVILLMIIKLSYLNGAGNLGLNLQMSPSPRKDLAKHLTNLKSATSVWFQMANSNFNFNFGNPSHGKRRPPHSHWYRIEFQVWIKFNVIHYCSKYHFQRLVYHMVTVHHDDHAHRYMSIHVKLYSRSHLLALVQC